MVDGADADGYMGPRSEKERDMSMSIPLSPLVGAGLVARTSSCE